MDLVEDDIAVIGDAASQLDSPNQEGQNLGNISNEEEHLHGQTTISGERNMSSDENGIEASIIDVVAEKILAMEFESEPKALDFYKRYAKAKGFGVRLDDKGFNKNGVLLWRKYVRNSEGLCSKKYTDKEERKREHRAITRFDCKACLVVRLNQQTGKWFLKNIEVEYSHDLLGPQHTQLLSCQREISEADKAQISSLVAGV